MSFLSSLRFHPAALRTRFSQYLPIIDFDFPFKVIQNVIVIEWFFEPMLFNLNNMLLCFNNIFVNIVDNILKILGSLSCLISFLGPIFILQPS